MSQHEDDGDDDAPYQVGYGKPPIAHQFKPGQSGNRKGRPKKSHNLEALLEEALNARIEIKERGKLKQIPVKAAIVKRLVAGAVGGDHKSIDTLIKIQRNKNRPEPIAFGAEWDIEWKAHVQRLRTALDEGSEHDQEIEEDDKDAIPIDDVSS